MKNRAPSNQRGRLVALGGVCLLVLGALCGAACATEEGVRCNPDRYSDECADGLTCTTPPNCAVSVCCPSPNQTIPATDIPAECLACAADAGAD